MIRAMSGRWVARSVSTGTVQFGSPSLPPPVPTTPPQCGHHGRYGFDGPGLLAMAAGLEVYEGMVRNSTPQRMREAMTASLARMRRQATAESQVLQ